jgi:hypothetical protein
VADVDEDGRLRKLRQEGVCPNCGKAIPAGDAVVRGSGTFCSLECVAPFYRAELSERAKRLASAARN